MTIVVPIDKPPVRNAVPIQRVLAERSIGSAAAFPKFFEKLGGALLRQGITEWISHYQTGNFVVVFATGAARIREDVQENRPSPKRICSPKKEQ